MPVHPPAVREGGRVGGDSGEKMRRPLLRSKNKEINIQTTQVYTPPPSPSSGDSDPQSQWVQATSEGHKVTIILQ